MDGLIEALQSIFTNKYGIDLESVLVFSFIVWVIAMVKLRKRKLMYKFVITLAIIYVSKVIDYTLLPLPLNSNSLQDLRNIYPFTIDYNVNLTPFFIEYFSERAFQAFTFHVLNIIMFIPLGMLITFFSNKKDIATVLKKGFLFSLSIEVSQLIMGLLLGASSRIFDLNDLIMNTLGAFIGFLIFTKIVSPLYKKTFNGESIYEIKN